MFKLSFYLCETQTPISQATITGSYHVKARAINHVIEFIKPRVCSDELEQLKASVSSLSDGFQSAFNLAEINSLTHLSQFIEALPDELAEEFCQWYFDLYDGLEGFQAEINISHAVELKQEVTKQDFDAAVLSELKEVFSVHLAAAEESENMLDLPFEAFDYAELPFSVELCRQFIPEVHVMAADAGVVSEYLYKSPTYSLFSAAKIATCDAYREYLSIQYDEHVEQLLAALYND